MRGTRAIPRPPPQGPDAPRPDPASPPPRLGAPTREAPRPSTTPRLGGPFHAHVDEPAPRPHAPRLGAPSPAPPRPSTTPRLGGPFHAHLPAPRLGGPDLLEGACPERPVAQDMSRAHPLDRVDAAIAQYLAAALQRFGAAALDVIDLPALDGPSGDPAAVELAAAVLWLREVEAAGMPGFIEATAAAVMSGRLSPGEDSGVRELIKLHRRHDQTFAPPERQALYDRVFTPDVDALIDRLADTLVAAPDAPPLTTQARVRVVADELAQALADRVAGFVPMFAREAAGRLREALRLAATPAVRSLFGPGDVWQLVARHGPALLGRPLATARHRARADAGQALLRAAARVLRGAALGSDDPAVAAAQRWRLAGPPETTPA